MAVITQNLGRTSVANIRHFVLLFFVLIYLFLPQLNDENKMKNFFLVLSPQKKYIYTFSSEKSIHISAHAV